MTVSVTVTITLNVTVTFCFAAFFLIRAIKKFIFAGQELEKDFKM
jgi:hypothetical protein